LGRQRELESLLRQRVCLQHRVPRGTTRTLNREAVYDYNFAAATRSYGAAVRMDVRNAVSCPAVNAYRQSLIDGTPIAPPSPLTDCPAQFGNEDIFAGVFPTS
jgi:hypothetical protein